MIIFEFQIEENVIVADKQTNLVDVEEGVLLQTYFVLPVRLRVNDIELFETSSDQTLMIGTREEGIVFQKAQATFAWLPLPILHLAIVGLERVQEIGQGEMAVYTLPGSGMKLSFQPHRGRVSIHSGVNGQTVQVNYDELRDAFEDFALAVRDTLGQQVPELKDHPQLGMWMKT